MAKPLNTCEIYWECFLCGCSPVTLHTSCEQAGQEPGRWVCCDGDLVTCGECGAEMQMSCDAESDPTLSWDETSEHNLRCAERIEEAK